MPIGQEAQLSQRDRAMLGVIENFAKSLKIIRNGILEKGVNPYFDLTMSVSRTVSEIFSVK